MSMMPEIFTSRIKLRAFRESDLDEFAAMNADERVMKYFPATLTRQETIELMRRIDDHEKKHGFTLFALEGISTGKFFGFTGAAVPAFDAHFTPCVEIGWRLAFDFQGKGLATEAALATVNYAFAHLGVSELVSFTFKGNLPSRRVMEKIGMAYHPEEDFLHPQLAREHHLAPHVLYRRKR